jgi:micrococcal nuclease
MIIKINLHRDFLPLQTEKHYPSEMYFRTVFSSILILISLSLYPQKSNRQIVYYQVKHVVDGDTFWIDDGSVKGIKVRLIGIDAPESRHSGHKDIAHFGKEATAYLERLIGGNKVRLEYDTGHFDRYGRTLAYVYLEDGTFVNAKLVQDGFATVMTVPPNVKYANTFIRLERKARNQERGLWKQSHSDTNYKNE